MVKHAAYGDLLQLYIGCSHVMSHNGVSVRSVWSSRRCSPRSSTSAEPLWRIMDERSTRSHTAG